MSTLRVTLDDIAAAIGRDKGTVSRRAASGGWAFVEVSGRGGRIKMFDVATLPEDVRDALRRHQLAAALPAEAPAEPQAPAAAAALPALLPSQMALPLAEPDALKGFQERVLQARAALLNEVDRLLAMGLARSERQAAEALVGHAKAGTLAPELMALVRMANARRGKGGTRTLSLRTVQNWLAQRDKGLRALAPKAPPSHFLPRWAGALMRLYARPSKPSLAWAVEQLQLHPERLPEGATPPSYDQARRFLGTLSVLFRSKGRLGPRARKAMRAYVARSVEEMWPSAIYVADGHTLDAMVRHPLTGKPFRPEITTIIDVYTRRAVGWSVGLAENTWGTVDALRHAVTTSGKFDIWYVDRGKGFNNDVFDNDLTGVLARLGCTKMNSLPYNSQARGVIERLHQSIWVRGAKTLVTYMGEAMDDEARQKVHKQMEADVKATGTSTLAMAWDEFIGWCQVQVDAYNDRPHSTLPKITDVVTGKRRHQTPNEVWQAAIDEGWQPDLATGAEADDLFRPYEIRTTRRGLVDLFSNQYFARPLEHWHGEEVAVGYDIHDASRVWVREIDRDGDRYMPGRLIAEAVWNGHRTSFVPVTVAQQAHTRRLAGQEKAAQVHVDRVRDERRALDYQPAATVVDVSAEEQRLADAMLARLEPAAEAATPRTAGGRPIFTSDLEWARWVLEHPTAATPQDGDGLRQKLRSRPFRDLLEMEGVDVPALHEITEQLRGVLCA